MLTIIHGDDTSASRTYLTTLKETADSPIEVMGESIDMSDLAQILDGGGLFETAKFISIENLLSNKKLTLVKEVIELLLRHSESHTIVIWENKELTKVTLQKFPSATIKSFKLPQTLFQLTDALRPENTAQLLRLFHETRSRVEDELIFYMLVRQMRILIGIKSNASISETKFMQSWQLPKYRKQADAFSLSSLRNHYAELYEIERQMKTGDGVRDTASLIDFFLIKI